MPYALPVNPKRSFGLAMGVFHSGGGFGHMNGWTNEFQVICLESLVNFSGNGATLENQNLKVRKRILDWYAKERPR